MSEPHKERNKPCAKCKAPGPHSFQFAGLFNHFNLRCMTCGYSWTYVAEELWDEAMRPQEPPNELVSKGGRVIEKTETCVIGAILHTNCTNCGATIEVEDEVRDGMLCRQCDHDAQITDDMKREAQ